MKSANTVEAVRKGEGQGNPPRRSFIKRIWALLGLLAGVELGWIGTTILTSRQKFPGKETGTGFVDVGEAEVFKPGTVTAVGQGGFYVSRLTDGGFLALASTCTHLGCALPWNEKERKFICPCHGSTFDSRGDVLTSPATRPLDLHPLRLENGVVRVDAGKRIRRLSYAASQVVRL